MSDPDPDPDAALLKKERAEHRQTRQKLKMAHETAREAKKAQSRYMAGIIHELRTPLNSLLGYVQLLEADAELPRHRVQAVRVMRRSAEHLADLIQGMLDISSIEAGALELSYQQFELSEFLADIAEMFERMARRKKLEFVYKVPENMPGIVRSDAKRLRQILTNLLSNAVRYTEEGGIEFCVNYRSHIAEFIVSDTGRGIAGTDIERIFLPFERLGAGGSGTGLGLTITRLFVDILGGDLQVRSRTGEGSRFTVRLFLAPVRHPQLRSGTDKGRIMGYCGSERRILVIDDDADQRQLLSDILSPLGFRLYLAKTGEEGTGLAKAHHPDLVILDLSLPDSHGAEIARLLRESPDKGPGIMVVSALAERAVPEAHDHAGRPLWDAVLSKPVNIGQLLEQMGAILSLVWIRQKPEGREVPLEQDFVKASQYIRDADIARLRESASLGHIRGFMQTLDDIESHQPEAIPAIILLKAAAEDLDMDRIETWLRLARGE